MDTGTSYKRKQGIFKESTRQKRIPEFDVTITHGSPRNPVWEYLLDIYTAADNFNYFDTRYCFVGHTHLPLIYQDLEKSGEVKLSQFQGEDRMVLTHRSILNPGSVGQPRDHDPRAAFAIFLSGREYLGSSQNPL